MHSGIKWLWIALLVLLFDRLTKILAQLYLSRYDMLVIAPHINFILAYNTGAAFSFLHHANGWQNSFFGIIATFASVIIVVYLSRLSAQKKWIAIAFSLILGGALGNLWDRILYAHVIDFIYLHAGNKSFPVFNIADSAVCLGAFIYLILQFFEKK